VRVYVAKQCDTTADLLTYTAAAKAAFSAALHSKYGAASFKLVEQGTSSSSTGVSTSGRCIVPAASDMRSAAMGMLRGYQPDRLFPQGVVQMGSGSGSPASSSNNGGFAGAVLDARDPAHRRSAAAAAAAPFGEEEFGAYGNGVVACWAEGAGSQQ
jgi:hypothetical protein